MLAYIPYMDPMGYKADDHGDMSWGFFDGYNGHQEA